MLTHLIHNDEVIPVVNYRKLVPFFSPSYLRMVIDEREYDGSISVTQCLRCPREVLFRMFFDYAVDPASMVFMIVGTKGHAKLEDNAVSEYQEEQLAMDLDTVKLKGIADLVFMEDGKHTLADYKTWGSYAVAKSFGIVSAKRPAVDSDGVPLTYKRSGYGYKAGQPKMETYYYEDPEKGDMFNVTMQTNMYRIMFEAQHGIKISKIRLYVIVRDGGLQVATSRGVFYNTYAKEISMLDDMEVSSYFKERATMLKEYIDEYSFLNKEKIVENPPPFGNERELLGGWACEKGCSVAPICAMCTMHPPKADYTKAILVDSF